jgi:hypothetical protein
MTPTRVMDDPPEPYDSQPVLSWDRDDQEAKRQGGMARMVEGSSDAKAEQP